MGGEAESPRVLSAELGWGFVAHPVSYSDCVVDLGSEKAPCLLEAEHLLVLEGAQGGHLLEVLKEGRGLMLACWAKSSTFIGLLRLVRIQSTPLAMNWVRLPAIQPYFWIGEIACAGPRCRGQPDIVPFGSRADISVCTGPLVGREWYHQIAGSFIRKY